MIKKSMPELCRMSVQQFREIEKIPLCLVVDNVRSQHNVGAFFRTADAFRLHRIYLCGITPFPPHSDIHKTALGAEDAVEWRRLEKTEEAISLLKKEGWSILALEQAHGSIKLSDYALRNGAKLALVVGNEVEGVGEEILNMSDAILEIPQYGTKHSLNVSVSAGIALYHLASLL